jgi:hypothetical protein
LITWAVVKSVILILGGDRGEENLEDTVAYLHEYELDTGDMEKVSEESERCFSHGFTALEETESKPPLFVAPAIAMAPPRETDGLYPPPPKDKDWDEHLETGSTKEKMCYLHIHPDKGLGRKNGL